MNGRSCNGQQRALSRSTSSLILELAKAADGRLDRYGSSGAERRTNDTSGDGRPMTNRKKTGANVLKRISAAGDDLPARAAFPNADRRALDGILPQPGRMPFELSAGAMRGTSGTSVRVCQLETGTCHIIALCH